MNQPSIDQYTRAIEQGIIEAQRLLKLGRDESLHLLKCSLAKADEVHQEKSMHELKALTKVSENALNEVQHKIGELNFLYRQQEIKTVENFDQFTTPIITALLEALATIDQLDETAESHIKEYAGVISLVWREIHLHLETIRFDLLLSENVAVSQHEDIRNEVIHALKEASSKHKAHGVEANLEHSLSEIHRNFGLCLDSLKHQLKRLNLFAKRDAAKLNSPMASSEEKRCRK